MLTLRLPLFLFSLQVIIFFLLSAFTDQKVINLLLYPFWALFLSSIPATFFKIWSNFIDILRGNSLRPDPNDNVMSFPIFI